MRRALALLLLAAPTLLPGAAALDGFPGYESFGRDEARILVRLPQGGTLRVEADARVEVAVVQPGAAPADWTAAPASFPVALDAPEASWHGLPGTVEVVLRRADARQEVRVTLDDGTGAGLEHTWPAAPPPARRLPVPDAPLLALAMGLVGVTLKRRRGMPGACASK